ncbi:MAG: GSCFA domain-containing protein [Muribaculaceae bacterium]|nr:GSCFA domain-containing protein [Muribaculaceae bacterium]
MKFRTEYTIPQDAPKPLQPERLAILLGSCFSDNIGAKMLSSGWPALVNPCGVLYNPLSICNLIDLALLPEEERSRRVKASVIPREGKYVSWYASSSIAGSSSDECAGKMLAALEELRRGLGEAQALLLTFGTADVWQLADGGMVVGNCHKYPASSFEKRRLGIAEIVGKVRHTLNNIKSINPDLQVILTVSPRRYLATGLADNTLQKAPLLLACHELCSPVEPAGESENREEITIKPGAGAMRISYFPAYEILNDDLRDYRFYSADLLHPSEMAVDYIWDCFTRTYLTDEARSRLSAIARANRRQNHRPIL